MKKTFSAVDLQRDIYLGGMMGRKPTVPLDPLRLEQAAREKISKEGFAYIAGGAGLEQTMDANRRAFERWCIVPRMLQDVSVRDTSVELFGHRLPSPFLTCPIGVLEMAHPDADLAVARATAALGIPMIFSNQASVSMEDCAAVMGDSPRFFQLYWSKSNDLVASLVQRAEKCGCTAIVLTLDTTMLGWRVRDLEDAYLPFLRGLGIAQYLSDPVFMRLLDEPQEEITPAVKPVLNWQTIQNIRSVVKKYPSKGSFISKLRSGKPLAAVRQFINVYSRPSLTWEDLTFLREHTKLPIVLKGILHPEDAQKAIDTGMDGIIVSNHGGRQVDGAVGSLDALPSIVEVVKNQIPVLFDSGIRSGADVFKAIALGAKAVCVGRPYAYGLAIGGEVGVRTVLQHLIAEFELTMGLSGCKNVSEITKELLLKSE